MNEFEKWWNEVGSGIRKEPIHDYEEHTEKVCRQFYTDVVKKNDLLHFVSTRNYCLVMLHDYDIVKGLWDKPHTYVRCFIGGIIWRFMPDFTFNNRRFMVVDYGC
jgi:hypothetical protein